MRGLDPKLGRGPGRSIGRTTIRPRRTVDCPNARAVVAVDRLRDHSSERREAAEPPHVDGMELGVDGGTSAIRPSSHMDMPPSMQSTSPVM
jgi:hypothetical protein